ncbi:MAG: preprotein translocase subunit YajC [Candidatus Eisenbacteria bacterium]
MSIRWSDPRCAWALFGILSTLAVPAAAQNASPAPGAPPVYMQFIPFILIFVIFYFLIIRPSQKKMKETQSMLSSLKKGDRVLTQGGFFGVVQGIKDDVVTLKLGDAQVECQKSAVTSIVSRE